MAKRTLHYDSLTGAGIHQSANLHGRISQSSTGSAYIGSMLLLVSKQHTTFPPGLFPQVRSNTRCRLKTADEGTMSVGVKKRPFSVRNGLIHPSRHSWDEAVFVTKSEPLTDKPGNIRRVEPCFLSAMEGPGIDVLGPGAELRANGRSISEFPTSSSPGYIRPLAHSHATWERFLVISAMR